MTAKVLTKRFWELELKFQNYRKHLVHRKKSENKKDNRGESKNIWARNQNSNKNEFWFYENEFKYINKKKWNEIHFIIPLLQPPNTPSYGGCCFHWFKQG